MAIMGHVMLQMIVVDNVARGGGSDPDAVGHIGVGSAVVPDFAVSDRVTLRVIEQDSTVLIPLRSVVVEGVASGIVDTDSRAAVLLRLVVRHLDAGHKASS